MFGHLHRPETPDMTEWSSNSSSHSIPNEAAGNLGLQYASPDDTLKASYIMQHAIPGGKVTHALYIKERWLYMEYFLEEDSGYHSVIDLKLFLPCIVHKNAQTSHDTWRDGCWPKLCPQLTSLLGN